MEPSGDLQRMYAAALAEQAALKRKLRALEDEKVALEAYRGELECRAEKAAKNLEVPPQAKGPAGPSDPAASD
jgi:predicted phage-related endonuclease